MKNWTFSLRVTLVTTVILSAIIAIFLTVGVMGTPAYFAIQKSYRSLWKNLSIQVSQTATEEILAYFQAAPLTLRFVEGLSQDGVIHLEDKEEIFDVCYRALKENPSFMNVYFASIQGDFYGALRENGQIYASYRKVGNFEDQTYILNGKNQWVLQEEKNVSYDPRKRPFWKVGQKHPEGSWTEPYTFATTNATGYTYVLGAFLQNRLIGFLGIDYQIDHLSVFLQKLNIGSEGAVFLITDKGELIAESSPKVGLEKETKKSILQEAVQVLQKPNKTDFFFEKGQVIAYLSPFPIESEIPWSLITLIHANDFLKPIREKAIKAFYWGLIPCLFFLILTALFFGKISQHLLRTVHQIKEAGNLKLDLYPRKESRIREINMMEMALERMKVGLQAFAKYVPMDLVSKWIDANTLPVLGGEKKEITVLFADLDHFTTLSETRSAEESTEILQTFLDAASSEVHKEKGIIDKFLGDAVMALWGAPENLEDHAQRSCVMALNLKERAKKEHLERFKIGVSTGEAVVGNFGSHERMDYTAIGDTVNIAARLEKLNKVYGTWIMISEKTKEALSQDFFVRLLDRVIVSGRQEPLALYELIGFRKGATENELQGVELYHSAFELYQKKQFHEARAAFQQALNAFGGKDLPSEILMRRAEKFSSSGVNQDWMGAVKADEI